jgi:hypothetical protein
MKNYIAFFTVVLFMLIGIGTMESQTIDQPTKGLKVTIMIYSGRPDPTFMITDGNTIQKIEKLLSTLPKNEKYNDPKETVSPNVLGYNGILVENFSDFMPDLEYIVVHHANIELKNKNVTENTKIKEFRSDNSKNFEDTLLQEALTHGCINQKLAENIKK